MINRLDEIIEIRKKQLGRETNSFSAMELKESIVIFSKLRDILVYCNSRKHHGGSHVIDDFYQFLDEYVSTELNKFV